MMSFLKPLEDLNNEGVRMYEQGRLQEAKKYFQLSIDEMFKVIAVMKKEGAFEAQRLIRTVSTGSCYELHSKEGVQYQSPIQGWSHPLPSANPDPDKEIFLFSRAIFLCSPPPSENLAHSVAALRIFKLAIQYNKALTHHQISCCASSASRTHGCSEQEDSEIAFYLYELAFQSCKEESEKQGGFSTTLDQGILMLALFNNMGVIFCNDLEAYDNGTECFKAACGVVLGMDLSQLDHSLDRQEMYQLSMNIWKAPRMGVPELI